MRALALVMLLAGVARAEAAAPRQNPFACRGEGESLVLGLSAAEMASEVDKRVAHPPEGEPAAEVARHHCVTAELMRRTGDPRAAAYYEKAIESAAHEPGFELWYAYYLRNVRGPKHPLDEAAEQHYDRVFEKLARA